MALDAGGRGGGKRKARRKKRIGAVIPGFGWRQNALSGIPDDATIADMFDGNDQPPPGIAAYTNTSWRTDPRGMKIAPQQSFGPGTEQPLKRDARAFRGPAPVDALTSLMDELRGMIASGGASFDYESALEQSEQAIRDAYAQDIKAIRTGNRGARRQAAGARQELERMYSALGQSYDDMGDKAFRQGRQFARQERRQSNRSARQLTGEAKDLLSENAALAEGLGIEEAYPAATKGVLQESLGTAADMRQEGARDSRRQMKYGRNARSFMQRGSVNAELEGTNRQADVLGDLQNFLQDSQRQIQETKASRAHEIASTRNAIQSQAAQMEAEASQAQWDQLMDLANLQFNIESQNDQTAYNKAKLRADIAAQQAQMMSAQEDEGAGLPDYMQQYAELIGQTSQPRRNMGVFDEIFSKNAEGRFEAEGTGEILGMNPEKAANIAEEQARRAGVPEQDIPMIRLAAMIRAAGSF